MLTMPQATSKLSTGATVLMSAFCLAFGALEMIIPSLSDSDIEVDKLVPVFKALNNHPRGTVFSPDIQVMRMLPTWANQGTLLDIGGSDFADVSRAERKELLFAYLYYSNVSTLQEALTSKTFLAPYAASTVFGKERTRPALQTRESRPITLADIEEASREYAIYTECFDRRSAQRHLITYLVADDAADLSNVDRWYDRVMVEKLGSVSIYLLSIKADA